MPTQEEILMARIAIEKKYLTESHVASIFLEQKNLESQGETFSLLEYLSTKNLMSPEQIGEVYQEAHKTAASVCKAAQGIGLVADKLFAHYRIVKEVGRGGMGIVYKAFDTRMNRPVALKILLTGSSASDVEIRRFKREAESAGGLNHPNVVSIYEIGECLGYFYFTMEFIEGETLDALIKRKFNRKKLLQIMEKVARALAHAHERNIIHRDIKPSNILISSEGEPKITDFGLAKKMGSTTALTQSGTTVGTPFYMAPEIAASKEKPDARADIYAMGVILYEILTGHPPFTAESLMELYRKIMEEEPPSPSRENAKVDEEIEAVCLKAMAKDRKYRYPSAQEMADDLVRYLHRKPVLARKGIHYARAFARLKRYKSQIHLVIGLAMGIAVAVTFFICAREGGQRREKDQRSPLPKYKSRLDPDTELYAIFSDPIRSSANLKIVTYGAQYNERYRRTPLEHWRMMSVGKSYIQMQFHLSFVPREKMYLFLEHLSSHVPQLPDEGRSPIDILVNGQFVKKAFKTQRPRLEDDFEIGPFLVSGENVIMIRYNEMATSHYWLFHAKISNKIVWLEDFEEYQAGFKHAHSWKETKGSEIDTSVFHRGRSSLKIESKAARSLETSPPWRIEARIFFPEKSSNQVSFVLCGKNEKHTRTLLTFEPDMTVKGSGIDFGQYDAKRWGKIQIDYNTSKGGLEIEYQIFCAATERIGHVSLDALSYETELSDLAVVVTQGACFLDDIRVKKK